MRYTFGICLTGGMGMRKKHLRLSLLGVCLLGTGFFLGVHHRVIGAMLKGDALPEAPKGHCLSCAKP